MNHPPPSILILPNEILRHIFTDLSRRLEYIEYHSNGKKYMVLDILVLRSVCYRFRAISAELGFWCNADFVFTDLIHPDRRDLVAAENLLRALFSDVNLINSIGQRKTSWTFENFTELKLVLKLVPLFKQNARVIHLEGFMDDDNYASNSPRSGRNKAICTLFACSHITELYIRFPNSIDLTAIAAAFPFLEILHCPEAHDFHGSLDSEWLSDLRTLHFYVSKHANQPWLSLRSAETLTELRIEYDQGVVIPVCDTDSLGAFVNLKSLPIRPLTKSFCEFINGARIQLDVFEVTLVQPHSPIRRFVDMVQAECLRYLKELRISNFQDDLFYPDETEKYWSEVFDAFTSALPSVQEVWLRTPLHVKWCPHFARMPELKRLYWDGSENTHFGFKCDWERSKATVLDATLRKFIEKREFVFTFACSYYRFQFGFGGAVVNLDPEVWFY